MLKRQALSTMLLGLAASFGAALAAGTGACTTTPAALLGSTSGHHAQGSGGSGGSEQGSGGGGGKTESGRTAFNALEGDFYMACGTCHDSGGISDMPFLAGPDRYESVVAWPNFVTSDPSQSQLLTFPQSGSSHPGKDLDSPDLKTTLLPELTAWLTIEAQSIDTKGAPDASAQLTPFAPVFGFNAVYLTSLGKAFEGMAITFTAAQLDDTTLSLENLEVQPTLVGGVHIVHPLFVVYPPGKEADPDPADSFSNLDQYIEPNQAAPLGPGTLILTNWVKDGRLGVAFQTIDAYAGMDPDGGTDGGTTSGCGALNAFKSDAQSDLNTSCFSCHGGASPSATSAVDMSKLASDPAAACAQILNRVKTTKPGQSQLFVTTDPNANAVHPFKFGGSESSFENFKTDVTKWISAE